MGTVCICGSAMALGLPKIGDTAAKMAKAKITCAGIEDSLVISAAEAKDFIKDIKNLDKDSQICKDNEKFCAAILALGAAADLDCKIEPTL